jgi:fatty-acid peroxygenase
MIPRLRVPDSSLAFLREGYLFGTRRADRYRTDAFRTRILGRDVVVARGRDAAAAFAEGHRFTRVGAIPKSALHLLQDEGSVQTLTDADHAHRKAFFLRLEKPAELKRVRALYREEWEAAVPGWRERGRIVLADELVPLLTRVALRWVGVPEADWRPGLPEELGAMIQNAGRFGPPNWAARRRRHRTERWARGMILRARDRDDDGSILAELARHRDRSGRVLDADLAGVELLNILRPTVAIGRFIVFAAVALHRNPDFQARDDAELRDFVNEVRRVTPFFPVVGGIAREPVDLDGETLPRGQWVLLDLYGTDHDPKLWPDPDHFHPDRFHDYVDRNALIPQGGGTSAEGHRCPGELATISVMIEAVRLLRHGIDATMPEQDLRVHLGKMPALPESGVILDVR